MESSKYLIYYTAGYNSSYVDITNLSIRSLLKYNDVSNIDFLVLCDESMMDRCTRLLPSFVKLISTKNSPTPEAASMKKLTIFDYIDKQYNSVLFIDSDILCVRCNIITILQNIKKQDTLYVFTESTKNEDHLNSYWSNIKYSSQNMKYFMENNIHVFNAGLFGFIPDIYMKTHFDNLRITIDNHRGSFFYEQSFMNNYFNLNNKTDRSVLTKDNYIMHPTDSNFYEHKLVHFCGALTPGVSKLARMLQYCARFIPEFTL